jgi:hypothetical protein
LFPVAVVFGLAIFGFRTAVGKNNLATDKPSAAYGRNQR